MMVCEEDMDTDKHQEPEKQTICSSLRHNTYWKCLVLSILIYGFLIAITWCQLSVRSRELQTHNKQHHKPGHCADGYVYIPVTFVLLLYIIYIIECWRCHRRQEITCKVDVNTAYDMLKVMQEAVPIVWWKCVCYHYMRRARKVTRYRHGDAFTSTQVYYERVNSHVASSCFNFIRCGMKDDSRQLINLEKHAATKIELSKGFSFSSFDAEQEFEEQRTQFFQTYECMDDYMKTEEGLNFMDTDFKPYMMVFTDTNNLPWYVSPVVFWIASVLTMSWPLRILIGYKIAYVQVHIHKSFGCNYDNTSSDIKNNGTMVPSYSEALLMKCSNGETSNGTSMNGNTRNQIYMPRTPVPNYGYGYLNAEQAYVVTCMNSSPNGYVPLVGQNVVGTQTDDTLMDAMHCPIMNKTKLLSSEISPKTSLYDSQFTRSSNPIEQSLSVDSIDSESDENHYQSHIYVSELSKDSSGLSKKGSVQNKDESQDIHLTSQPLHPISSPQSDPPPSYGLVLAMRRAAALAAGILPTLKEPASPSHSSSLVDQPSSSRRMPSSHSCITFSQTAKDERHKRSLPSSRSLLSTFNTKNYTDENPGMSELSSLNLNETHI